MPDDVGDLMKFGVGQPVTRAEDPRLLTGGGKYTADFSLPGQAYVAMCRSTVAHGIIKAIDTSAAKAAPGVIAVYTGADLQADGLGSMPCIVPLKGRNDSEMVRTPHYVLPVDRVRHVGDPYAFVVAETQEQARDAAELVELDVETLPPVIDAEAAAQPGAQSVWDQAENNVCLDWFFGDEDATNAAFAKADHVTSLSLENNRVVVNALEPRAALADFDKESGRYTLYTPSQGVFGLRANIANNVLNIPPDKLRVLSYEVGGSFGMKGQPYSESMAALYSAGKLARPVKWVADRGESFLSDQQGRASHVTVELALDKEGTILALRMTGYGNVGAYLTMMGPAPLTGVVTRNINSVYRIPTLCVAVKAVYTNTVPTGPYRGAGRPESKYYIERLVEQAARDMGLDPIAVRKRNLLTPAEMPAKVAVGAVYDSGDFPGILDAALEKADFAGFPGRRKISEAAGKLRGFGIGHYLEISAPSGIELADIRFRDDGSVFLVMGNKDMGQGHASPFAQVLVDALGVPFDRIELHENDTDEMFVGGGSGGSRSAIAASGAILEASAQVIENGKALAGLVLEAATEDIEFDKGTFRVAGTDRAINIMELAAKVKDLKDLPDGMPSALDAKVKHETSPSSYPNGCHICEAEIDPETGEVHIDRYIVVDDFGTMLNPLVVEGQVHGGVAQGIGQALLETTIYDETGQLLTGSYMDYPLPRADEVPPIGFTARPVPCTTNPLGVKGCGEGGVAGALPAAMNAVMDALNCAGVDRLDMPATPHRIWQALKAAKAA